MLQRLQLEYRLKELGMTKLTLAKKMGVTPMTIHNKFNDPSSFKVSELESMVKIGFFKIFNMRIMNDTQNQIIRQSSLKASIDFWNLKTNGNCEDITESDIIKTASHFGYWCANGKVAQNVNNKLLK